jgi:3-methyladenine DNA glycosylase AlkC
MAKMKITSARLSLLNEGKVATSNLAEVLAVDFAALLGAIIPGVPETLLRKIEDAAALGIVRRMWFVAEMLHETFGSEILPLLSEHESDTARGWACFISSLIPGDSLDKRLENAKRWADDAHFGVREWAWLAMRPHISNSLEEAIGVLSSWTKDDSERIRRFASESTRPRGVWCAHIDSLKNEPSPGLAILEPLRNDTSAYVQDSVGNWLNDASKTRPEWVRDVCARWRTKESGKGIERICTRALRSINKERS